MDLLRDYLEKTDGLLSIGLKTGRHLAKRLKTIGPHDPAQEVVLTKNLLRCLEGCRHVLSLRLRALQGEPGNLERMDNRGRAA